MNRDDFHMFIVTCAVITCFVSLACSWYYGTKMTLNRKPGVPYFPGGGQRPGNILLRPHELTEKGLEARRAYIKCLAVFAMSLTFLFIDAIL
jgi:hypothetical protein